MVTSSPSEPAPLISSEAMTCPVDPVAHSRDFLRSCRVVSDARYSAGQLLRCLAQSQRRYLANEVFPMTSAQAINLTTISVDFGFLPLHPLYPMAISSQTISLCNQPPFQLFTPPPSMCGGQRTPQNTDENSESGSAQVREFCITVRLVYTAIMTHALPFSTSK